MRQSAVAVVIMSSEERLLAILANLESLDVEVLAVGTCREAREVLRTETSVDLVITDVTLPDGNWCDILTFLVDQNMDAAILVASEHADGSLWAEAVWRGAYSVLGESLDSQEARWVIEGALGTAWTSGGRARRPLAAYG